MKIVSVEATKVEYPRLKPMTVPRSGPSRSSLNAQATPLRRYTKDPGFRVQSQDSRGRSRCRLCRYA